MGDCIAELNGLNPSVWLKDTLIKLPAWPNNRIDELTWSSKIGHLS
ncbi:transposase domain-containing protein [Nitrosomonas eutropha]